MSDAVSTALVDTAIAKIDAQLSLVVDAVLHHPSFQRLEAAWRGLAYVVREVPFEQNVRIEFCHVSRDELQRDITESAALTRSWLFRTVYSAEYGQFGGTPFAALIVDYAVGASPSDVAMLRGVAGIAAMAHAPAFVAAAPSLLQLESFIDVQFATDLAATFEGAGRIAGNALREIEDSRYVGVLAPRILMRAPHVDAASSFVYDERVASTADRLWGSPAFAFAVRLAKVFAAHRSYLGLLDRAGERPPVLEEHATLGPFAPKPTIEVVLSPRVERMLTDLGLIALGYDLVTSQLVFRAAPSLQRPRQFGSSEGGEAATLNFFLGTRFPYILLASRFAHYLKIIERERVGATSSRIETERELNDWLR
jgi:type VI secretion system protein ImpC